MRGKATAALDISDGLLADCGHIAAASCVRLVIEQARVPLSDALVRWAGRERALQCGLAGGDDYVLAFALPEVELSGLLADGWPIRVIGRVEAGEGVRLLDADGRDIPIDRQGYNHFNA